MHLPVVVEPLERGVYIAPYTVRGAAAVIAVTSWGDRSAVLRIGPNMPEPKARRILTKHLDNVDPLPRRRLRIVR